MESLSLMHKPHALFIKKKLQWPKKQVVGRPRDNDELNMLNDGKAN